MATQIATANTPNPLTGLSKSFLVWHYTEATLADAFLACNTCWMAGWMPKIAPIPNTGDPTTATPPTWGVQFTKNNFEGVFVADPDWIAFDGTYVWGIANADIPNYTLTTP